MLCLILDILFCFFLPSFGSISSFALSSQDFYENVTPFNFINAYVSTFHGQEFKYTAPFTHSLTTSPSWSLLMYSRDLDLNCY